MMDSNTGVKSYRKRPEVVYAKQWFKHGDHDLVSNKSKSNPSNEESKLHGYLETNRGEYIVNSGDWIVQDYHNEYFVCKPNIFKRMYEEL